MVGLYQMKNMTHVLVLAAALLSAVPAMAVVPERSKVPTQLERALEQGVDRTGSTRDGGTWTWRRPGGMLRWFDQAGAELGSKSVENAMSVDFEPAWGIAVVTQENGVLVGADERRLALLKLDFAVSEVAWLGPGRLAVAPVTEPFLVGVVDVARGGVVARWGVGRAVSPGPGFHLQRHVLLRRAGSLLWTLDTSYGTMVAFDSSGKELARATAASGGLPPTLAAWVEQGDRESKAAGRRDEVVVDEFPSFAVMSDGRATVVTRCADDGSGGSLIVLSAGAAAPSSSPTGPCCWRNILAVGESLLSYPSSQSRGERCVGRWAIPGSSQR